MEFISMTCRNCGGKLSIIPDADQCVCGNCQSEFLIFRHEGAISLKQITEGIQNIKLSSDKTASELALARLREERDRLLSEFDAILIAEGNKPSHIKDRQRYELIRIYNEAIKEETRRWFPNNNKIAKWSMMVTRMSEIDNRITEISSEEIAHNKIVNS